MSLQDASTIAEFLSSNPPLALLNLTGNRFVNDHAAVLANSLSSNTNLMALCVHRNEIKEEGRLALLRAIFDVSSLNSCAASNHTCRVWGLEQDISALNDYADRDRNKWDKIFAMLASSSEDEFINTALLSGLPASLMPILLDRADDQDEVDKSGITDLYLRMKDIKRCRKHDDWDKLGGKRPLNCVQFRLGRSGAAQKVTPRLADDRVERGTRNRTICEQKLRASRAWGADFQNLTRYDTKPKQANKAREIGRAEENEMIGSSVEDRRTIDLDVKWPTDHDASITARFFRHNTRTEDKQDKPSAKPWGADADGGFDFCVPAMEVGPRKKAKTCPDDDTEHDGAVASTAARQIAELRAELDKFKREHDQVVRDLNGCKREHNQVVAELEREKIATEERHDQLVRNLNGALKWAYTVNVIPWAHWLEKGHSANYAAAMERLQDAFKRIIKQLRTGTVDDLISVTFCLPDHEDNYAIAAHDDLLIPYWREFANALIHWSDCHADGKTLGIIIDGIATPDAVLDVLRPSIKQSKVRSLGVGGDGSPITWKLAEFIEDIIQTNHSLTTVCFSGIMLTNEEWKAICNAIEIRNEHQSSTIESFQLLKCSADEIGSEVLEGFLTSIAHEVDLGGNGMSSRVASIIAESLESNPPLATLYLRDNHFDDADAAVLANSLSSNTNLTALYVDGNNIKEEGRLALLRALFDVSSLNSCAASNHTCRIWGLEQDISALNYDHVKYNKWDKIFAMLASSSEDAFINTALLSGIPTSLMPILLDRAYDQNHDKSGITDLYLWMKDIVRCRKHDDWDKLGGKRPLNCVYELFRSLVVPSIYV
ncbi:hypothetical protein THAOC_24464 [Thalassiosira oceanica]|uniref:Uncharacterized protein n=1 Tax=Thalassiosira oceanica TaxID=159749 RepID=K0SAM1_THAOC|nr:hypothetical protein THAOC_24464 [Thalassiosira oceanica]|eukprot:EJK55767.1 hypothetical protein THAOC_24464 [Thalassiosira oceanica]